MKVMCSGVWDREYVNRRGEKVQVVCVRLTYFSKTGTYEYPYPFQLPAGSVRPESSKFYDVDFSFGYYMKDVETCDSSGELVKTKEKAPTWHITSISEAK